MRSRPRRAKCDDCGKGVRQVCHGAARCRACRRQRHAAVDVKLCNKCGTVQPKEQFAASSRYLDGRQQRCKSCWKLYNRKYMERLATQKRAASRRRRYGITQEEIDSLVKRQDGRCLICRVRAATHLDHDHVTRAVRGLLCDPCNRGLGAFRDSPSLLRSASYYLEARSSGA